MPNLVINCTLTQSIPGLPPGFSFPLLTESLSPMINSLVAPYIAGIDSDAAWAQPGSGQSSEQATASVAVSLANSTLTLTPTVTANPTSFPFAQLIGPYVEALDPAQLTVMQSIFESITSFTGTLAVAVQ
jgi:hypothetical protein